MHRKISAQSTNLSFGAVCRDGLIGFLFLLSFVCVFTCGVVAAQSKKSSLHSQIARGVPLNNSSSLVVLDAKTGEKIYAQREAMPLKPASVLKILTTKVAFDKLGPEHRFPTEFYGQGFTGSRLAALYIKGYGDPLFTHEQLWLAARKLFMRGVRSVGQIYVDDTAFVGAHERGGQKAYLAASSALSLNFNTLTFEVCPTTPGKAARVFNDPFEYIVGTKGKITTVSSGKNVYGIDEFPGSEGLNMVYRLQGTMRSGQACDEVYRSVASPALYAGAVLKGILQKLGVDVVGGPTKKKVPSGAGKIYTHQSKELFKIIRDLNHFSSNFIAEQLLVSIGKESSSTYVRAKGIAALEAHLASLGEPRADYSIHDASGLSHDNRITARALSKVLLELRNNQSYGAEFVNSLSVDGRRGTLRKRNMDGTVRAKTGTINNVGTLAGLVQGRSGRDYAFVILQNKIPYRAKASAVEKKLVRILHSS